jgi:ABC-type glutathione transport system ATPase component
MMAEPIMEVDRVEKFFSLPLGFGAQIRRRSPTRICAVGGVSFQLQAGETFGLVGESGCGKSTLARLIVGLLEPDAGRILFRGREMRLHDRASRRRVQMVFQDSHASLNPRLTIGAALEEPLAVHHVVSRGEIATEVRRLIGLVGLSGDLVMRYPAQLSGGQRQRVTIARALSVRPDVLVADEITSGLDASVRAQVLHLLRHLQREFGLSLVFITHDLRAAEFLCDRVAVMRAGKIVEIGLSEQIFSRPENPYTRELLAAIPNMDPNVRVTHVAGG